MFISPKTVLAKQTVKPPCFRPKLLNLLLSGAVVTIATFPSIALNTQPNTAAAVDELLPVDCLLPGTVRKLGSTLTYVTARRPTKTTGVDCEIRGGEYVLFDRADYQTALSIWKPLAEQGDAQAQNYVGEIYERGLGVEPDFAQAAHWYNQAAKKGFSAAQVNLGQLHEQGLGVERSMDTALEWYRKAAGFSNKQLKFVSYDYSDEKYSDLQEQLISLGAKLNDASDREALLQAQLRSQRQQLLAERSLLESERLRFEEAKTDPSQQQLLSVLQTKISTHEQKLADSETLILEKNDALQLLSDQIQNLRLQLATDSKTSSDRVAADDRKPVIQILDPVLISARGDQYVARTRSGATMRTVLGRVNSDQEISELLINGTLVKLDSDGLFQHRVRIEKEQTKVEVVAIDNLGWRSDLEFVMNIEEMLDPALIQAKTAARLNETAGLALPKLNYGNYHALLIGNKDYENLPDLDTTISDIDAVGDVLLNKYGFQITKLENANRYDILSSLETLRKRLGKDDNLLIYYAGHGELDQVNRRGHWLPVDAEENSRANWISNVALSDILNAMSAHKVLVIADSCYSGAMTRSPLARFEPERSKRDWKPWLKKQTASQSRLLLSSGGVAPVQDGGGGKHSVFAKALLDVLDRNETVLEGRLAHALVSQSVITDSQAIQFEQTPLYAPLKFTGHEGGDFLFVPVEG